MNVYLVHGSGCRPVAVEAETIEVALEVFREGIGRLEPGAWRLEIEKVERVAVVLFRRSPPVASAPERKEEPQLSSTIEGDNVHVQLSFDPAWNHELAPVFDDTEARTFWLLWRRGHIVSQTFAEEALVVGGILRAVGRVEDFIEETAKRDLENVQRADLEAFAREWWRHLIGSASVTWSVKRPSS